MIEQLISNNSVLFVRCNPADRNYVAEQISTYLPSCKRWSLYGGDFSKKPVELLLQPLQELLIGTNDYILEDFLSSLVTLSAFEQQYVLDLISKFCISGSSSKVVMLQTDNQDIPHSLTHLAQEYYWPLPTRSSIAELCETMGLLPSDDLISTGTGLCFEDLRKGLSQVALTDNPINGLTKYRDQRLALRGISILPIPDFTEIAGLDLFQKEITDVAFCFSSKGRELKLPFPKGQLLMGPPGTGKTYAAIATAAILRFPILSVNADAIISRGISGLTQVIQAAAAVSPCVLLLDEVEKLFGEVKNEQLFGHLLTFMNDNTDPIFILGTLNRPEKLKIEMKRNGRIDECWFFTYPDELDRKEAICLFLKKYGVNPLSGADAFTDSDWSMVVRSTNYFVPAEIKRVIEKTILSKRRSNPNAEIKAIDIAEIADNHSTMFKQDEIAMIDLINAVEGKARPAQSPGRKLPTYQKYNPSAPLPPKVLAVYTNH
jgi:ATP-dependent 26S proteasome regulatory subunit